MSSIIAFGKGTCQFDNPMPEPNANWPLNWDDYEAGRSHRNGSEGSLGSHVQFDEAASTRHHILHPDEHQGQSPGAEETLRRRRYDIASTAAQNDGELSFKCPC